MRILITGAGGTIGKGLVPRLQASGHQIVLSDVNKLEVDGIPFHQIDIQNGFGLEKAAEGCDLILHLPAWHGIHSGSKTEADFWRLNVDGTFWMFQAAQSQGIKKVVFLSSTAWYGHYDKYGFTKRVGEELCEYNRQRHDVRYAAVRPNDLTPFGNDWLNRYGAGFLYGRVDREDVLDCICLSVAKLAEPLNGEPENIVVEALRANVFTAEQIQDWESDPIGHCEQIFPGYADIIEKYALNIKRKPWINDSKIGWDDIGYAPSRHFGTFLAELRRVDSEGGEAAVRAMSCPY